MANTIFKLAMHPAAQAKVIEEVDSLGPGARPGWDDMPKLPYTEACFQVRPWRGKLYETLAPGS